MDFSSFTFSENDSFKEKIKQPISYYELEKYNNQHSSKNASSEKPSKSDEKIFVQWKLKGRSMLNGEVWFLVSQNWFGKWMKYVGYEFDIENESDRPGPIDNLVLVENREEFLNFTRCYNGGSKEQLLIKLREGLVERKDFVLLPIEVWDYLLNLYGGKHGSSGFAPTIARYSSITWNDWETPQLDKYPFFVKCAYIHRARGIEDLCKFREFRIPSFISTRHLRLILVDYFLKDNNQEKEEVVTDSRIWISCGGGKFELVGVYSTGEAVGSYFQRFCDHPLKEEFFVILECKFENEERFSMYLTAQEMSEERRIKMVYSGFRREIVHNYDIEPVTKFFFVDESQNQVLSVRKIWESKIIGRRRRRRRRRREGNKNVENRFQKGLKDVFVVCKKYEESSRYPNEFNIIQFRNVGTTNTTDMMDRKERINYLMKGINVEMFEITFIRNFGMFIIPKIFLLLK